MGANESSLTGDVVAEIKRQNLRDRHGGSVSSMKDSLSDPSEFNVKINNEKESNDKHQYGEVDSLVDYDSNITALDSKTDSKNQTTSQNNALTGNVDTTNTDLGNPSQKFRSTVNAITLLFAGLGKSTENNVEATQKKAKSYDESDNSSSSDSDEEMKRNINKSFRRSQQSLSSLASRKSQSHRIMSTSTHNIETDVIVEGSISRTRSKLGSPDGAKSDKSSSEMLAISGFSSPSRQSRDQQSSGEWNVLEADSVCSRGEHSNVLDSDDEVAAAIAVKPRSHEDDENEDERASPLDIPPISACGTLDIAVQYFLTEKKLQITIVEANDLPSKDRGGASIIQVRAVVLPMKRKRYKTKVQHIHSPRFSETFKISQISPQDLRGLGLRVRLYGIGKVKDRLIGEATMRFDELNLMRDPQLTVTLQLEPRMDVNRGDPELSAASLNDNEVSSVSTLAHGGSLPELLLSLSYNEITGRLCVEVVKGSHFRNLAMSKPPDTFVKIVLLNSGCEEMAQSKTAVQRAQPNPRYMETFYFQVALFQLAEVSLMVSVYCSRTIKKKYILGWVSLGKNSSSDSDEQHWQEMIGAKGNSVSRWHTLIET